MKHDNGIELSVKESNTQPKVPNENNTNKICIHHRMGKCRRGEKCPFKHENKSQECIFYKRGHCSRGNECRYTHKKEEIINPNQNNDIERRRQPKSTQLDERNQQFD